jgi:GntR family transcriptional regulator
MSTSFQQDNGRGFAAIAEGIRRDLLRGVLLPGGRLPAISDLAGRFRTTPITVRRALRALEDEGLVRVEHGNGTFVTDWARGADFLNLPAFAEAAGAEVSTRVVSVQFGVAALEAAAALGLQPQTPTHALRRVRLVGSNPVVLQTSYVAEGLRRVLEDYTPEASLYQRLTERVGRPPTEAEELIEPVLLGEDDAALLARAVGTQAWRARRTTFSGGEPVVYDDALLPSDRVRIRVRRRGAQALMQFDLLPEGGEQ